MLVCERAVDRRSEPVPNRSGSLTEMVLALHAENEQLRNRQWRRTVDRRSMRSVEGPSERRAVPACPYFSLRTVFKRGSKVPPAPSSCAPLRMIFCRCVRLATRQSSCQSQNRRPANGGLARQCTHDAQGCRSAFRLQTVENGPDPRLTRALARGFSTTAVLTRSRDGCLEQIAVWDKCLSRDGFDL